MVSIGKIGSAYCDFLFGSSADAMVTRVIDTCKYRKDCNYGLMKSLYQGTKQGCKDAYTHTQRNGGFFSSMWENLKDVKSEWQKAKIPNASFSKNFIYKCSKIIKPLGKAAPAILAMIGLASELPNIWRATKEEGLLAGVKETGKTALKLTFGALCGGFGTKLVPVIGSTYGFMVGNLIGDQVGSFIGSNAGEFLTLKAMGGSYTAKHEKLEKLKEKQAEIEKQKQEQEILKAKQQEYEKYRQLAILKNVNNST